MNPLDGSGLWFQELEKKLKNHNFTMYQCLNNFGIAKYQSSIILRNFVRDDKQNEQQSLPLLAPHTCPSPLSFCQEHKHESLATVLESHFFQPKCFLLNFIMLCDQQDDPAPSACPALPHISCLFHFFFTDLTTPLPQAKCLCASQIHMLSPNTLYDGVRRWGTGSDQDMKVEPP